MRGEACLYGGAFNPPHLAHERVIRACLEQLPVERVLVMPAARHPFAGRDASMAGAEERLELCRLAFGDLPRVEVSDAEIRRGGTSYTIDTLLSLPGRPFLVIGSDNLPTLHTWHRYREVLARARLAIAPRPGWPADAGHLAALDLPEDAVALARVLVLEESPVSASQVRDRLRRGHEVTGMLRPVVEQAIRRLGLYSSACPSGSQPPPPPAS